MTQHPFETQDEPTQDELLDYHMGMTDPVSARKILAYLKSHPQAAQTLEDYAAIETSFKSFKLSEPSAQAVLSVIDQAKRDLKPGFLKSLSAVLVRRELAWTAMIAIVVGLGVWVKGLTPEQNKNPGYSQPISQMTDESVSTGMAASLVSATATAPAPELYPADDAATQTLKDYATALGLYQQSKYREACDYFALVMTDSPQFEKRLELYTYWIDALEKLGLADQASAKRDELKSLQ